VIIIQFVGGSDQGTTLGSAWTPSARAVGQENGSMARSSARKLGQPIGVFGLLFAMVAAVFATPSGVRAQEATAYSSAVIAGTCDAPTTRGMLDLGQLLFQDPAVGYATSTTSFEQSWEEITKIVLAEPAIAIVYKGTSLAQAAQSEWVLCGSLDASYLRGEDGGALNGYHVALKEMNNSAMAGVFQLSRPHENNPNVSGTTIALENAIVHWTPESSGWENKHRFTGSRGTCEAPSTEWWQWEPLIHTGPVASYGSVEFDTQIVNFTGGDHFFAVYDQEAEGSTVVACGNAKGKPFTVSEDFPDGLLMFPLHEMNNSGYVGFVLVYNFKGIDGIFLEDNVLILTYLFPGARR
jgi:hypothetical protein